jgi:hypothetical protein
MREGGEEYMKEESMRVEIRKTREPRIARKGHGVKRERRRAMT